VPLDALWVPDQVHIEDAVLCFDWSRFGYLKSPPALLERFLALRGDETILTFASRYGPLGLSSRGDVIDVAPEPFSGRRDEQREPVTAWRRCQAELNELLSLAAAVREQVSPPRDAFEAFQSWGTSTPAPRSTLGSVGRPWPSVLDSWQKWSTSERLQAAARVVTDRISSLVRSCRLMPAPTVLGGTSSFTVIFNDVTATGRAGVGISLIGALTVQLLAAVTGAGFAVCSACGKVFVPRRRSPAFGRRRYCRACGRSAALRDAKADYRRKLRRLGRSVLSAQKPKGKRRRKA
jgi:hypothetical protein